MQTLGPYRIIRTIAMGGMGEVFLAALERTGGFEKQVALKCVLPRFVQDSRFQELFEREARLAAVLNHRNIVQVFDFGYDQQRAWLAMEYVDGIDLKGVVDTLTTPLPVSVSINIAVSVARALYYAHGAVDGRGRPLQIIHRDVSPQNILLSFEGDVKLADFGLAQAAARNTDEDGSLKGKFAYMSPEQVSGRALDGRSDQFSLGVVLYEALSGQRAFFREGRVQNILETVLTGQPIVPLREAAPHLPAPICSVVERAMQKERRHRFADCKAMADALINASREAQVSLGEVELGAWLKGLFPQRTAARRQHVELTVDATAVAGAPIADVATDQTMVADNPVQKTEPVNVSSTPSLHFAESTTLDGVRPPQIDFSHSLAEPSAISEPEHQTAQSASDDDSASGNSKKSARRIFVLAVLGLASILIATTVFQRNPPSNREPSSKPLSTHGQASRLDQSDAAPPSVDTSTASVLTSKPILDSTFNTNTQKDAFIVLDGARKNVESRTHKASDVGVSDAGTDSSSTVKHRLASPIKPKVNSKPRHRKPSSFAKQRPIRKKTHPQTQETRRKVHAADTKNTSQSPRRLPKKTSPTVPLVAQAKDRQDLPTVTTPKPSLKRDSKSALPAPSGLRYRIRSANLQVKHSGASLGSGWRRLMKRGANIRLTTKTGARVQMRLRSRSGRFDATIHSKPHGSVEVDGRGMGPTPAASIPLKEGRQHLELRLENGHLVSFVLEVAQ